MMNKEVRFNYFVVVNYSRVFDLQSSCNREINTHPNEMAAEIALHTAVRKPGAETIPWEPGGSFLNTINACNSGFI